MQYPSDFSLWFNGLKKVNSYYHGNFTLSITSRKFRNILRVNRHVYTIIKGIDDGRFENEMLWNMILFTENSSKERTVIYSLRGNVIFQILNE